MNELHISVSSQPPGMGMGVGGPAQMESLSDDIQLNKAENAWKPSTKKTRVEVESESDDSEHGKTQELFKSVRSILNKLTPQKFQQLMKMVTDLTIDTEERLKGVIDLTFEAIAEPNFSVAYANMCRCLMGVSGAKPMIVVRVFSFHFDLFRSWYAQLQGRVGNSLQKHFLLYSMECS